MDGLIYLGVMIMSIVLAMCIAVIIMGAMVYTLFTFMSWRDTKEWRW